MKKIIFVLLSIVVVFTMASCSKKEDIAAGTWYSTKPDTLEVKGKGIYTSQWLTSGLEGKYTVKDNAITFISPDGKDYKFEQGKEDGKDVLVYKSNDVLHTYYMDKEFVDSMIKKQKEEEEKLKQTQEEENKKQSEEVLVGVWEWIESSEKPIEFTADGKYKFTNFQDNVWKYEIVDKKTMKITKDDGESFTTSYKITETENGYELVFRNLRYKKK